MEWDKIIYEDCMNEKNGLPSLPDKSIDLGFTDPPWGIGYDGTILSRRKTTNKKHIIIYEDKWNPEWNLKWFYELKRVCNNIILVLGQGVYMWWIRNTKPIGMYMLYYKNGVARSKVSQWRAWAPYLVYGKLKNKPTQDVIETVLHMGFLKDKEKWIHPSPKSIDAILKLLKAIKPKTLIDIFVGSGTFIYAAHMLNIPWLGYEINPIYKHDVDLRFRVNHNSPINIKYWLK